MTDGESLSERVDRIAAKAVLRDRRERLKEEGDKQMELVEEGEG